MSDWTKKLLEFAAESTSNFDLSKVSNFTRDTFARALGSLSDADRLAVRKWATSAREIRANAAWSAREKEEQIQGLDNNATIFKLLRALFDAVAEQAPIAQKRVLKVGLTAAAVATAGLNFEITGVALIALRAALPTFLLSEAGQRFADAILEHTADVPVHIS